MLFPLRDENPSYSFPLFTVILIALNGAVFLLTFQPDARTSAVLRFGFTPELAVRSPEVLVTSTFLHANLLHFFSNMWFLWLFGDNIEDRFGRIRYLFLYIVSGIAGNVIHAVLSGFNSNVPVIGASGAVAGVMGSYIVRFPFSHVKSVFFIIFYPIFFKIPALLLLGIWMVGEFYAAIVAAPNDFVAHWAHVGGFLFGVIWTLGRRDKYYRARGWWW